jgi:hypothetical protein
LRGLRRSDRWFGIGTPIRNWVALGATGKRKDFDMLYGKVRDKRGLEVRSGHPFLFANSSEKD